MVTSFTYLQTASCTCARVYGDGLPYVDKDVRHSAYREKTCTAVRQRVPISRAVEAAANNCKPRSGYLELVLLEYVV
ncbi:hypothetical protein FOMPIDRAFT_1025717 [Fomitopsis schrenkii]|uniref:Uncharacterized protein n=1 Tax=Fomitopsis schrenkii TaxID=2126942 RepID=S8DWQ2_FOMSC|nr:hypothetical protein FOMPIDRAFT_1025717 [Fomitopsis schrenkii]